MDVLGAGAVVFEALCAGLGIAVGVSTLGAVAVAIVVLLGG